MDEKSRTLQRIIDIRELFVHVCSFVCGTTLVKLEQLSRDTLGILRISIYEDYLWKNAFNSRFGYFVKTDFRTHYKRMVIKFQKSGIRDTPYRGFMKKHILEQLTPEEMFLKDTGNDYHPEEREEIIEHNKNKRIRCHELRLIDSETFECENGKKETVLKALTEKIKVLFPGYNFTSDLNYRALMKYGLIHAHLEAGYCWNTGQEMYVNVIGNLIRMDGMDARSDECKKFRQENCRIDQYYNGFKGKMEFSLIRGNFSSSYTCGIGLTCYG